MHCRMPGFYPLDASITITPAIKTKISSDVPTYPPTGKNTPVEKHWSKKSPNKIMSKINSCCFKPLSFGIVCYTTEMIWYRIGWLWKHLWGYALCYETMPWDENVCLALGCSKKRLASSLDSKRKGMDLDSWPRSDTYQWNNINCLCFFFP